MAGVKILSIDEIRLDELRIKKPHDDDFNHKQIGFIKKYGQFIIPIIAKVNGVFRVVDGVGFIKNYESLGNSIIQCNLISDEDLTVREFMMFRLFHNIKRNKVDHLVLAEIIRSLWNSKADFRQVGIRTNISQTDVERYSTLLDFDWDEFSRKPLNSITQQMSLFDILQEEDEIF